MRWSYQKLRAVLYVIKTAIAGSAKVHTVKATLSYVIAVSAEFKPNNSNVAVDVLIIAAILMTMLGANRIVQNAKRKDNTVISMVISQFFALLFSS